MKKNILGIPSLIFASLCFAAFSALNRIVPQDVGTFHQLLIRGLLMGGVFLLAGFLVKDLKKIQKKDLRLFLFRGFLVAADFSTFFIAISYLQIGVTLFLFYAGNVIANYLYGFFLLHEKITKIKMLSITLAFIGLATMYITSIHAFTNVFVFFALFSGFAYGFEVASSKHLEKYSVNQVNGIAFLTAGVLSIPLLFFSKETSAYTLFTMPWAAFLLWISVGIVAFYAVIYGFKYVEAQKASLICLSEILFGIAIGLLIYREIPTIQTIIGGCCIVVALALPNIHFRDRK